MNTSPVHTMQKHPWILALQGQLDGLEQSLLSGDATGVARASAGVQAAMQNPPRTAELGANGGSLRADLQLVATRFGQLRQAVLRAQAHNQRGLHTLLPQQAKPTYGQLAGVKPSTGGAGRAFLSA